MEALPHTDRRDETMNPNRSICSLVICFSVLSFSLAASAAEEPTQDFGSMDLSDLLNVEIVTASLSSETLLDAPASMYVLTRVEIERRGYHGLYGYYEGPSWI